MDETVASGILNVLLSTLQTTQVSAIISVNKRPSSGVRTFTSASQVRRSLLPPCPCSLTGSNCSHFFNYSRLGCIDYFGRWGLRIIMLYTMHPTKKLLHWQVRRVWMATKTFGTTLFFIVSRRSCVFGIRLLKKMVESLHSTILTAVRLVLWVSYHYHRLQRQEPRIKSKSQMNFLHLIPSL